MKLKPFWKIAVLCSLLALLAAPSVAAAQSAPHSFAVGKGQFLFDGKPFIIKAGEVHYPRIPEAYWLHRIDVARFCRLAQQEGMYVIVRPGPYACAEWDMGGLPWWLLRKKDMQVRTSDPYFLERAGKYMKRLGRELADLQITRGGNIIMVQVENEYGLYGDDKAYVSSIRDMVREAGFTDIRIIDNVQRKVLHGSRYLAHGLTNNHFTVTAVKP